MAVSGATADAEIEKLFQMQRYLERMIDDDGLRLGKLFDTGVPNVGPDNDIHQG